MLWDVRWLWLEAAASTGHLLWQAICLRKSLSGSELVLVDINKTAAETMKKYCEKMLEVRGANWKVTVDELDSALEDASIVCISISTGGLNAMALDYDIPEKYGIYHTVGDTVGPGGIFRSLRNIPVFIDIARKMERICPDAWLVHVTNPLSQLTRAVCMETSIKCVDFAITTQEQFPCWQIILVLRPRMLTLLVGVNHFTWMKTSQ